MALNGFTGPRHQMIRADVLTFLENEADEKPTISWLSTLPPIPTASERSATGTSR